MNRSTASTIAVVLVLVLVVVGVAVVVGLGTDGASAVEVGSQKVSREDVNDELRAIADNDQLAQQAGADRVSQTNGSLVADAAVALVLNGTVQEAIIKEYLDRKGEKVTQQDVADGKELWPQTGIGQFEAGFPKWYSRRAEERLAVYSAFSRVTGVDLQGESAVDDIAAELRPFARKVGVTVDPRYGRFDPRNVTVVPYKLPTGLVDSSSSAASN
jgi:SurA-like protein